MDTTPQPVQRLIEAFSRLPGIGPKSASRQTDRIDFYQLHNPRLDTIRNDEVFDTLNRLRDEGKILSYGTALGPAINERQIDEAIATIVERRAHTQIIFNLLEQMLGEKILPVARQHPLCVFVRVPHSSGLLEGGYDEKTTFGKDDHRSFRVKSSEERQVWLVNGLKKVNQLKFLTGDTGRTIGQAAIKFILKDPSTPDREKNGPKTFRRINPDGWDLK